jgi:hypothetical protein
MLVDFLRDTIYNYTSKDYYKNFNLVLYLMFKYY